MKKPAQKTTQKKVKQSARKPDSSSELKSTASKSTASKSTASKSSASRTSTAGKAPVAKTRTAKKASEAKTAVAKPSDTKASALAAMPAAEKSRLAKSPAAKSSATKSPAAKSDSSKTADKPRSSKNESKATKNIPKKIEASALSDYLEIMSVAVFQASVSWALILNKLDNFRIAFDNFDPERVSTYDEEKIDSLMLDAGILRNEKKIRATITNAKTMISLAKEHGSFPNYLHSFKSYELLAKDMKKQFKFFGDLSVYYFLFRIGEPVPDFNKWIQTIPGEHPRMREMVEQYEI